jgi:hypothetical protein
VERGREAREATEARVIAVSARFRRRGEDEGFGAMAFRL